MGWAWINVANPSPGGGASSSSALTTYQVINLDVNRMSFDPFTRKLYATVPSTATQVTGNSLVAIDPASGGLGSPLNVGSEPNRISESSDGQYLYIGLDGSKSVTNVDLRTMNAGPVIPINVQSFGQTTQVAARDLAVAPGNDNLLAIDTGSFSGDGLMDISGSIGTMRPNLTGPYTGSNLAFADGSTLYSYDNDTTGAEFNRWTLTSSGLARLGTDMTGYTLNGIGGFSGSFKLANGVVYGFGGGVANPTTTPPKQLGQFYVSSALGSSQSIEGSGVAPDPASGRVFILGETLAGSANPVLLSYDSSRYVMLSSQQFTGLPSGLDLVRWGRDGLAWHTSLGFPFGGTSGTGKIILMRGPFVLPAWITANAVPAMTSVSPANTTAGSGNLMLTVAGSGFVQGAVVRWNGAERTTTFVDSAHVTVAIPASDLSQSGSATVDANNPGSGNSNSISFAIN
jgi:trimeric autotransporter adhesin